MSRIERSNPVDRLRRNAGASPQSTGVRQAGSVPSLTVHSPNSQGVLLAGQFLQAVGRLGQAADATGEFARRKRAAEAREQAVHEKATRDAKMLDEGYGAQRAAALLPEFLKEIEDGVELLGTDANGNPVKPSVQTKMFAQARSEEFSFNEAQARGFIRTLERHLPQAYIDFGDDIQAQVREDSYPLYIDNAISDGTSEAIIANMTDAVDKFGITTAESHRMIWLPVLRLAVQAGNVELYDAAIKAMPDGFVPEKILARQTLDSVVRREQNVRNAQFRDSVFGMISDNEPTKDILSHIDKGLEFGDVSEEDAIRFRAGVVSEAQGRFATQLRTSILTNTTTPDAIATIAREAAQRDPEDPLYIPPTIGASLINEAKASSQLNDETIQVLGQLNMGNGHLTSRHNGAFMSVIGPRGEGLIDSTNRIAQPEQLAQRVLRTSLMPPELEDVLLANLQSGVQEDVIAASAVLGNIHAGNPRTTAAIEEKLSRPERIQFNRMLELGTRGDIQNELHQGVAAASIIQSGLDDVEDAPLPSEIRVRLERDGTNIEEITTDSIDELRSEFRHAKNINLIDLWGATSPDPKMPKHLAPGLMNRFEQVFVEKYMEVRNRAPGQAVQVATDYSKDVIRNEYDFVRWHGKVFPTFIGNVGGLRMPEHLRWSDGFEDDAKAEFKKFGFAPSDAISMGPWIKLPPKHDPDAELTDEQILTLRDPAQRLGWVFLDEFASPITDDKGKLLFFSPEESVQQRAAEYRETLRKKAQQFEARRNPGKAKTFMELKMESPGLF